MTAYATTTTNTWTKWDGAWVVRGSGDAPAVGSTITITKKSGESKEATITGIILTGTLRTGSPVWLANVKQHKAPAGVTGSRARFDEAMDYDRE